MLFHNVTPRERGRFAVPSAHHKTVESLSILLSAKKSTGPLGGQALVIYLALVPIVLPYQIELMEIDRLLGRLLLHPGFPVDHVTLPHLLRDVLEPNSGFTSTSLVDRCSSSHRTAWSTAWFAFNPPAMPIHQPPIHLSTRT